MQPNEFAIIIDNNHSLFPIFIVSRFSYFIVLFIFIFVSQDSQNESIKHKETLANELTCLREELKKIVDDRDRVQGRLNAVIEERENYIKFKYETYSKLDKLAIKTEALEVCFLLCRHL